MQDSLNTRRSKLCFAILKPFMKNGPLRRFGFHRWDIATRFQSMDTYLADRTDQIDDYRELFGPFASFEGKTVLELGSNRGYLLNSFLEREHFEAIGTEIDPQLLKIARDNYGDRIMFVETTPATIPLPDASVDIIYTIDTVEHLSEIEKIFDECLRILRPGGIFLIHFSGWLGPYGPHLEDIIPVPWMNTVFSMDTLLDVAAHIYDSPEHEAACYWVDDEGTRRSNPYRDRAKWDEFLNMITIRRFRKIIRKMPVEIVHLENIGFGGKFFKAGKVLGFLSRVPIVQEFFTKATFAVLGKPSTQPQD